MRWRCPNQCRRRCRRRDDAVGCLVRSRMLRLLMFCCQNIHRRRLWQHMSNTSRRRRGWWTMLQSHRAKRRHVDNGSYCEKMDLIGGTQGRSSLGNARCNVTRGRAIIRDERSKICKGIDKLPFRVAYLQWQMVGGVRSYSHAFGVRPAYLHPH